MTSDELKRAAELRAENERLRSLLARCGEGFSAFIMGRRLARKERDKLIYEIKDELERKQ